MKLRHKAAPKVMEWKGWKFTVYLMRWVPPFTEKMDRVGQRRLVYLRLLRV